MDVDILSGLATERLGNRLWVLTEPFIFSIDGEIYTVPRGFVFDGASCPRPLWSICAPVAGPFGEAAVAHDWLYDEEGPDIGRLLADRVLYELGRLRGIPVMKQYGSIKLPHLPGVTSYGKARAVKAGVNVFGASHYKKGVEKLTAESCYNLEWAQARVAELRGEVVPAMAHNLCTAMT